MKSNKFTDWMFTPFKFIAGSKALFVGIAVMVVLSILGYFSNVHFDGVLDIHLGHKAPYLQHAIYQLSTWVTLTVVFYATARIVSKSGIRIIDIAGTMALSQAPFILAALWGFVPGVHIEFGDPNALTINELTLAFKNNIGIILLNMIVLIIPIVWTILLRYNAYSVSANMRGIKAIISFVIAIIISEILSKIILYLIIPLIL